MESLLVCALDLPVATLVKQERDESIAKHESGVFSASNATDSSANTTDDSFGITKAWESFKGEVVDPDVFNPLFLQNVDPDMSLLCNISSISGDNEMQCK